MLPVQEEDREGLWLWIRGMMQVIDEAATKKQRAVSEVREFFLVVLRI